MSFKIALFLDDVLGTLRHLLVLFVVVVSRKNSAINLSLFGD